MTAVLTPFLAAPGPFAVLLSLIPVGFTFLRRTRATRARRIPWTGDAARAHSAAMTASGQLASSRLGS